MKRYLIAVMLAVSSGLAASAQAQVSNAESLDKQEVPQAVAEQVTCDGPDIGMMRRAFAGGIVFTATCPGNHANYIQALVYAKDAQGANARLLMFPRPGGDAADSLSNIRWFPETHEVTELFVDPESKICRTEGRWRVEAEGPPKLVFWRQTRDCDGKKGWRIVTDRRVRR
jgi:hypothetical protein